MKLGLASNFYNEIGNVEPIWDIFKDVVDMWTVVDSGSDDGTQDKLIEVVGDKLNLIDCPKITEKGFGYGYARTKLIESSKGMDWVLIIDGDERMLPEDIAKLQTVIQVYNDSDVIFLPRCHYQNWEMTKVEYGSMDKTGSDWKQAVKINPDWQARLIKRIMVDGKSKVYFENAVHEAAKGFTKHITDLDNSPVIRHFGWMKPQERLDLIVNLCKKLAGVE